MTQTELQVVVALLVLANTIFTWWIGRRVSQVHHEMNSMKDRLVDNAHTIGVSEGRESVGLKGG